MTLKSYSIDIEMSCTYLFRPAEEMNLKEVRKKRRRRLTLF